MERFIRAGVMVLATAVFVVPNAAHGEPAQTRPKTCEEAKDECSAADRPFRKLLKCRKTCRCKLLAKSEREACLQRADDFENKCIDGKCRGPVPKRKCKKACENKADERRSQCDEDAHKRALECECDAKCGAMIKKASDIRSRRRRLCSRMKATCQKACTLEAEHSGSKAARNAARARNKARMLRFAEQQLRFFSSVSSKLTSAKYLEELSQLPPLRTDRLVAPPGGLSKANLELMEQLNSRLHKSLNRIKKQMKARARELRAKRRPPRHGAGKRRARRRHP
jgi:hypothetical protein